MSYLLGREGMAGIGPWAILSGTVIVFLLDRPQAVRARARADLPRGRDLVDRLAGAEPARRARDLAASRRRRCGRVPHRLPRRAEPVARQPVRLPDAVRVLRDPTEHRPKLLFWGIVAALVLRGLAILGGVALIEQFHFVIYVLGVSLLVLAYRIYKSSGEEQDPEKNLVIRTVQRVLPGEHEGEGRQAADAREGQARRDAAAGLPRGDRVRRHRVRHRLDPRRLRHHPRPVLDLDGQRLRAARPARAVRARRGPGAEVPLPRRDDRRRARDRRREAADRGHREDRPAAVARDHRRRVRGSASGCRSPPTSATLRRRRTRAPAPRRARAAARPRTSSTRPPDARKFEISTAASIAAIS